MGYSITYRKKRNSRFIRVILKDWDAVLGWLLKHGDSSFMLHIRTLNDADQEKGAFLRA